MPQTFCHLDAARRNLYLLRDSSVIIGVGAFDWVISGIGAIGEEIAPLIITSYLLKEIRPEELQDLETNVITGYMEGLRDSGWDGNIELVKLGYVISSIMRFPRVIVRQMGEMSESNMLERFFERLKLLSANR